MFFVRVCVFVFPSDVQQAAVVQEPRGEVQPWSYQAAEARASVRALPGLHHHSPVHRESHLDTHVMECNSPTPYTLRCELPFVEQYLVEG